MDDTTGYAVFFFPQALEALGEAIKPYLLERPGGDARAVPRDRHRRRLHRDDTRRPGRRRQGSSSCELMVPSAMVRMIVSARSDEAFGFGPRIAAAAMASLPPVGADRDAGSRLTCARVEAPGRGRPRAAEPYGDAAQADAIVPSDAAVIRRLPHGIGVERGATARRRQVQPHQVVVAGIDNRRIRAAADRPEHARRRARAGRARAAGSPGARCPSSAPKSPVWRADVALARQRAVGGALDRAGAARRHARIDARVRQQLLRSPRAHRRHRPGRR